MEDGCWWTQDLWTLLHFAALLVDTRLLDTIIIVLYSTVGGHTAGLY